MNRRILDIFRAPSEEALLDVATLDRKLRRNVQQKASGSDGEPTSQVIAPQKVEPARLELATSCLQSDDCATICRNHAIVASHDYRSRSQPAHRRSARLR